MKSLIIITGCVFSLLFAAGQAANRVSLTNSCGDTIVTNCPFTINVAIENDVLWYDFSLTFRIYSPDGASWIWVSQGSRGYGTQGYVTLIPGCRMDPVHTIWDFGFLITEQNVDGVGSDTMLVGGVSNAGGMPLGPKQDMFQFNLLVNDFPLSEIRTLCIDSVYVHYWTPIGWADTWVANSEFQWGFQIHIEPAWQSGGICWPVKSTTNGNPLITGAGHIDAFHCVPGSFAMEAFDPEDDDVLWTGQQLSGQGTFSILNTTGTSNSLTYTPAPDELSGTASILMRVEDRYHPSGHLSCGRWQDTIIVQIHSIGDANNDNSINVGDAVYVINYVFKSGPAPAAWKAGDANCDGLVNVGDAVRLINHVFKGAPSPVNACCQ